MCRPRPSEIDLARAAGRAGDARLGLGACDRDAGSGKSTPAFARISAQAWSIYPGKKGWTVAYRRWLTTVRFQHPAQQIVFQDYVDAVSDAEARVERLTTQIADLVLSWSLAPAVEAVQAMRGVAFIVAITVVAEVGDFIVSTIRVN